MLALTKKMAATEALVAALQAQLPTATFQTFGTRIAVKINDEARFDVWVEFDYLNDPSYVKLKPPYNTKVRTVTMKYDDANKLASKIATNFVPRVLAGAEEQQQRRQRLDARNTRVDADMKAIANAVYLHLPNVKFDANYLGSGNIKFAPGRSINIESERDDTYRLTFTGLTPPQVWTIINTAVEEAGLNK